MCQGEGARCPASSGKLSLATLQDMIFPFSEPGEVQAGSIFSLLFFLLSSTKHLLGQVQSSRMYPCVVGEGGKDTQMNGKPNWSCKHTVYWERPGRLTGGFQDRMLCPVRRTEGGEPCMILLCFFKCILSFCL